MTESLPQRLEHARKLKERAIVELESLLDPKERKVARRDHHARRKPRHCGITIHTGIGCSYGCVYCYIWDMGFPGKPKPYPLNSLQMAYALALNPYVVPRYTFAAYGSVTEPFLEETKDKAVDYMRTIYRYLLLPSQVSTKSLLTSDLVKKLINTDPNLSLLISITGISEKARRLEPRAPDPIMRIESASYLKGTNIIPTLFIRRIIPGVTDKEFENILDLASNAGIRTLVLGTLRVTSGIVRRLKLVGVEIPPKLLPRRLDIKKQQYIQGSHIKRMLEHIASNKGFLVLPSACSANVYSHRSACYKCRLGPCGRPSYPSIMEVKDALSILELDNYRVVDVSRNAIRLQRTGKPTKKDEIRLFWLRDVSRLDLILA